MSTASSAVDPFSGSSTATEVDKVATGWKPLKNCPRCSCCCCFDSSACSGTGSSAVAAAAAGVYQCWPLSGLVSGTAEADFRSCCRCFLTADKR